MSTIILGIFFAVIIILLLLLAIGPATAALFFGRKFPWLWFALSSFILVQKIVAVALYLETDNIRAISSLVAGLIAFGTAFLLQKRFPNVVLIFGGFLTTALTVIQVLGPLLNPVPRWLVVVILIGAGIAGAIWTRTNQNFATIILSAMIGAGVWTNEIVDWLQIDETLRFQVQVVIALFGIGFQIWRMRRGQRKALESLQGASI